MTPTDRLAAYLADELTSSERSTLEEELARDGDARAMLAAMRRADEALAELAPLAPLAGFEDRVHAAVDTALTGMIADQRASASPPVAAARPASVPRRSRHSSRGPSRTHRAWLPALAGATAGLAALAGIGFAVNNLPPGDEFMTMASEPERAIEADDGQRADQPVELAPPGIASVMATPGPVIVELGRQLAEPDLLDLLNVSELVDLAAQVHPGIDGAATATRWSDFLRAELTGSRDGEASPAPPVANDVIEPGSLRVITNSLQALDEQAVVGIEQCLADVAADGAIPTYVEVAVDDRGRAILVFGVVATDSSGTGAATPQVRVLAADGCGELARYGW